MRYARMARYRMTQAAIVIANTSPQLQQRIVPPASSYISQFADAPARGKWVSNKPANEPLRQVRLQLFPSFNSWVNSPKQSPLPKRGPGTPSIPW